MLLSPGGTSGGPKNVPLSYETCIACVDSSRPSAMWHAGQSYTCGRCSISLAFHAVGSCGGSARVPCRCRPLRLAGYHQRSIRFVRLSSAPLWRKPALLHIGCRSGNPLSCRSALHRGCTTSEALWAYFFPQHPFCSNPPSSAQSAGARRSRSQATLGALRR